MADADAILEVMKKWVGQEEEPWTVEVDKTTMAKVAWCVDDPNPLWRDEEYARQTRFGGIIACPYFLDWLRHKPTYGQRIVWPPMPTLPGNPPNVVGGEEVEYLRPIRPGDVITVTSRTTDVKKRWSKSLNKDIVIQSHGHTFTNQFGEVVATRKGTSIKTG